MGQKLRTFPILPQHIQTVVLDDQFRVELTFRDRTSSWYMDIYELDGTPVLLGRRLSPSFSPTVGLVLEDGPEGIIYVSGGFDPYTREALEENMKIIRFTVAELVAQDAVANPDDGSRDIIVVL